MKIGIIGPGRQGWRLAKAIKDAGDELIMTAAEKKDEKSQLFAKTFECAVTYDWRELVERDDLEAVVVCTPPNLHKEMVVAALKAKKHVLCEKPLASNVKEAQEILAEVERSGYKLKCGFNLRHHLAITQAKKMVDEGLIGELMFVRACYGVGGGEGYEKDWRMKKEISGGGELMDQGVHILDLSRWFLGEFKEVFGNLSTNFWEISPLEDNVFVTLRTEKNQTSFCHISWTQWKNLFSFEIYGKEGYLAVKGLNGNYGTEKLIFGKRDFKKPFKEEITEFRGDDKSWIGEWKDFTSAIKEDRQPLSSGYDGLESLKLAEAVYESAEKKQVIKLIN
ncbi:MAG: Gfo/Idh/MocA family oxidoreductase [bacterium]